VLATSSAADNVSVRNGHCKTKAIVEAADEMMLELRRIGYRPSAIVIAGRPSTEVTVSLTYLVTPDWELDGVLSATFHILGMHRNVPIFELDHPGPPALYVVDLAAFGRLIRYGETPEFALDPIEQETAATWLQSNPTIISSEPPFRGFEYEHVARLMLRVHLRLYERYELKVKDRQAVVGRPLAGL
jgi:hypothetical protein